MKLDTTITRRPAWTAFVLTVALFSLGLAGTEINKIDVRFALMQEEMGRMPFGIFPTLNGLPYPDYPLTYFFFSYLTTGGGRWVNMWSMTLPSILLAGYTVAMTLAIGEKTAKSLGIWAAMLAALSFEYMYVLGSFGIDVPVAAAGITMLYLLQTQAGSWRSVAAFVLLLAWSFAMRGSLGIVVFGAATAGWLLAERRWRDVLRYGIAGAAATAGCVLLAYLAIRRTGGDDLMRLFLDWQVGKRMEGGDYFYYFLDGAIGFAPTSFFAIAALWIGRRELGRTPLAGWLGFLLLPMVILSIPGGKHLRYLACSFPALALIAAWGVLHMPREAAWRIRANLALAAVNHLLPYLGIVAILGMSAVFLLLFPAAWLPWANFGVALALFAGLRFWTPAGELANFGKFTLCVVLVYFGIAIPTVGMMENSQAFTRAVESGRQGKLYFYEIGPDHEDLKYILHMAPERRSEVAYLYHEAKDENHHYSRMFKVFVSSAKLPELTARDVVIVKPRALKYLEIECRTAGKTIVSRQIGQLGHRDYLAVHLQ